MRVSAPSAALRRLSARIGRWPRRIAALLCLVLAAGSALVPHAPAQQTQHLRRDQVAVPVPVRSTADVSAGDDIGLLSAPGDGPAHLVADHLRVVSVHDGEGLDGAPVVVVVASRADAVTLAENSTSPLLLVRDDLP